MKKYFLFVFTFLSTFPIIYSQNFSFYDNLEVYVRPFEYVINNWNTNYTLYNSADINVYNPLKENIDFTKFKLEPIQLKNYVSQEYGLKYFLKAHKTFKIGIGVNYKKRKLVYDIFIPIDDKIVIWALRYNANYDYLGFNLNFRLDVPKIKSNINFYWELNYPFNKDKSRPELTYIFNSYVLFIQTQHSIPKSIVDGPYIGIDFNSAIYKKFYINFHLSYKYDFDYFSRFFYYKINDNGELHTIFAGSTRSNDFILGLGIVYQFSK